LQFADSKVRLDVDGNPTMAAKLIGVVLGGEWVKNTIIAGIELALKDPTVISAIEKTGLTYANLKQQEYKKFLDTEEARLRRLIKAEGAGIQLE
jgi:hypothetical protein